MTSIKLVHVDSLSCEAILRQTPNKELIIVSQCKGGKEPHIDNRVFVFHSKDDGKTFSKPTLILPDNNRAVYCTEVAIIDQSIYVFLTLHNGYFLEFENIVLKSDDNGYSWNETHEFPKLEGFTFVRGLLKLSNGDLIFPYQQYKVTKTENNQLVKENKYIWNAKIKAVINGTMMKKKHATTWEITGSCKTPLYTNNQKRWQWTEPTLAQLKDTTIVMLLRINQTGYLYKSISTDHGMTFSEPVKTNLKNPGNKPKLIMLPNQDIALLNTFNDGSRYIDRNPLSLWISNDDMKTWYYKKDLVTFPGWLSYPDGFATEDGKHIKFAFEFNRHDIYYVNHQIEGDLDHE